MMNFVSKTRNFVSKPRNFASRIRNFVLKMMDCAAQGKGLVDRRDNPLAQEMLKVGF